MEAARETEVVITATSPESFEKALSEGLARASASLRGVQRVGIKDQRMLFERGNVVGYQVNLVVVFDAESEESGGLGVVLEPQDYRRLVESAEELEDVQAYDEAVEELRTGEDVLVEWGEETKAVIEIERAELRERRAP